MALHIPMSRSTHLKKAKPHKKQPTPTAVKRIKATKPQTRNVSELLADYQLAWLSRHISLLGRKEVLNGRAKFGVFGAGKELAQIAMAKAMQPGDVRRGYYRDQTILFALDLLTPQQFFAGLYGHVDKEAEPTAGGRAMNPTCGLPMLDEDGRWLPATDRYNSSSDISPTGSAMPPLVGLAQASKLYRELEDLHDLTDFSQNGDEVAFGTIGNASCAEGMFWESVNAIGVLGVPAVIAIWDDEYGISVPNKYQHTKGNVGPLLEGFRRDENGDAGFHIFTIKGWDYEGLVAAFAEATNKARQHHIPAIIHVVDMVQPQGHTTSGSHERYKSKGRLEWEKAHDPLLKMREWLISARLATADELDGIESACAEQAKGARTAAWEAFCQPNRDETNQLVNLLLQAADQSGHAVELERLAQKLREIKRPIRKDLLQVAHQAVQVLAQENSPMHPIFLQWREGLTVQMQERYSSHLYSQSERSPLNVTAVPPQYGDVPQKGRGFEIIRANFDAILARDPRVVIFGEDVGYLGDVNQGLAGLQAKYGELRVSDTGIREATIIGQAIGLAQRGLRPIAEIQYLDYILYGLMTLSDDLATLHWRTAGGQKAPAIIRTRGHRLEGVFHSGSPMGALCHLLRGMHIVVPRNMTQAAGLYNTLLQGDDPALVVERLNGYRLHEPMPTNHGEYTVPLGVPETLRMGEDVTLVTYGACCAIALEAADALQAFGIDVEIVDVQTLLPFDRHHVIAESVAKTSRLVVLDEDVPGGASAYILREILETQGGYWSLDAEPMTITSQPHRPAYSTDGDYFSKPNKEMIVEKIYGMMRESNPAQFQPIWEVLA